MFQYADEAFTDHMLAQSPSDRKVRTPEELAPAMAEPPGTAPARILWLHASLLDEARRLWERGHTPLRADSNVCIDGFGIFRCM